MYTWDTLPFSGLAAAPLLWVYSFSCHSFPMQRLAARKGHRTKGTGTLLLWDGPMPPRTGQQAQGSLAEGLTASPGTAPRAMERERRLLTTSSWASLGFAAEEPCKGERQGARAAAPAASALLVQWLGNLQALLRSPCHSSPCAHTHACIHTRTLLLPASGICPLPWKQR